MLVVGVLAVMPTSATAAAWGIQPTPNPPAATSSQLLGVSCPSASACTAVGAYATSSILGASLAERWNGSTWEIQPTPNPAPGDGSNDSLDAVSCASTSACMAVGFSDVAGASTLAESWNGSTWAIEPTPSLPAGSFGGRLNGVSCPSATDCVAVGYYENSSSIDVPLAERWNGSTWMIQATPTPNGSTGSDLNGVSCASLNACTAVGSIASGNVFLPISKTLAERWDGSTWVIQPTPNPTINGSLPSDALNGVSCSSGLLSSGCTAVGDYNSDGNPLTLAENWNGKTWSVQPTPNPSPPSNALSVLRAVSCTYGLIAPRCAAVGGQGVFASSQFAFRRQGLTWTVQPMPLPPGVVSSVLSGMSCTSATACTAVGYYLPPTGTSGATFAERYS